MITSQEINWIAGIVEGEGYIGWARTSRFAGRPILVVDMTDKDILKKLAHYWNTKVVTLSMKASPSYYKQKYRVRLSGTRAASWIMTLYSLFGSRRQQRVLQILNQWKIIHKKGPKPSGYVDTGRVV